MKRFIFLFYSLHIITILYAQNIQNTDTVLPFKPAKNTIFLELLGNSGNLFSINYDRILYVKNKIKMTGRMGTAYSIAKFTDYNGNYNSLSILSEFSLLYGKEHCFEAGIGLTYMTQDFFFNIYDIYLTTRIVGYRYQPSEGGVFFKAGVGISLEFLRYYRGDLFYSGLPMAWPLIGLSSGYTF